MPGYGHVKKQECAFYDKIHELVMHEGKIMYLGRVLEYAYKRHKDTVALIYKDIPITYQQLYTRAIQVSKKLQKYGVKPRDRVLLFFENSPEFYSGYYGILQMGAVVVPLNTFLHEKELVHIMNDAKPSAIVTSKELREKFDGQRLPVVTEDDMVALNNESLSFSIVDLEQDELCALLYTSGTTGFPKGVMLSSKNCMTNVLQAIARVGIWQQECLFGVLPLFHSFAQSTCVWAAILVGCTVIVIPRIERRYILEGLQYKPTIFLGVPALYGLLILLKTAPLDSVKCFVSGGDALPDKIRAAFELVYGRKICNGYGLTEASPLVAADLEDHITVTSNIGTTLCGIESSIRDEKGTIMPQGSIGELWLKGGNIMLGYYNDPEMTQQTLTADGWLRTGDLAYSDEHQNIIITGRIKDLIIHKGFNIYPQEIENVIMLHSNVIRVGVIGRDDAATGQVPIAYVQLRVEEEGIERKLQELCLKNVAAYKVPKQFICTTRDLSITTTGKVDKKQLRALEKE